jgi:hypothetical protein
MRKVAQYDSNFETELFKSNLQKVRVIEQLSQSF